MIAKLVRFAYTPNGTLGRFSFDSKTLYSVERPWLQNQPNISCIPEGFYKCRRVDSPKFGDTFEVTGVPNRTHILFHVANHMDDLQGCIGLGARLAPQDYRVMDSRVAMSIFLTDLEGKDAFDLYVTQYKPEF